MRGIWIIFSVPQGGQFQAEDIQAMIQVSPQFSFGNRKSGIPVRCGDHSYGKPQWPDERLYPGEFVREKSAYHRATPEADTTRDRYRYCCQIVQSCHAIGVADGNEISVPIFLIDRQDFGRRNPVDRIGPTPWLSTSQPASVSIGDPQFPS